MPEIRLGSATDKGNYRNENEDAHLVSGRILAVADGMGGHNAGEVASALAIEMLRARGDEGVASAEDLVDLVSRINSAIHAEATATTEQRGMGTTLTVVALSGANATQIHLANVGDSRAYLYRAGVLRQLSIDHSYVQELVSEGLLTPAEARKHPRRNIVTRALGIDPVVEVDSWTITIAPGDRLLLCSDGLVDEVDDEGIAAILSGGDEPEVASQRLVDAAKSNGGRDNITVVVADPSPSVDRVTARVGTRIPSGRTVAVVAIASLLVIWLIGLLR
jgi:serine/threonine protein phosphatase PrpC